MPINKIEHGRARFAASVLSQRGEIFAARRAALEPASHQSGASSPASGAARSHDTPSMASIAESFWSRRKGGK